VSWRKLGPELLAESQFIIVLLQLGRLQQAADLGSSLMFGGLCIPLLLLLFDDVKLRVVSGKLSQRDEEVTQSESELVVLGVEREKTLNERRDLGPKILWVNLTAFGCW
jgi:hypothetical protein